jgi:hypothetical protein
MPSFQVPPHPDERLTRWRTAFRRVGWFAPAFVSVGLLDLIADAIERDGDGFGQERLQSVLANIYAPERLAAMTLHRYTATPVVKDFCITISEAVQAHMIGLHHLAIGGLVPVIEGIGKRFAQERNLPATRSATKLFKSLMDDYKREAVERNIGVTAELSVMLDTFSEFTTEHLYIDSTVYPLADKTNRNGITHGAYADVDYGTPINFFKAISAIDVLTFTSIMRHGGSVFVPDQTPACTMFIACTRAQAELKQRLIGPVA